MLIGHLVSSPSVASEWLWDGGEDCPGQQGPHGLVIGMQKPQGLLEPVLFRSMSGRCFVLWRSRKGQRRKKSPSPSRSKRGRKTNKRGLHGGEELKRVTFGHPSDERHTHAR